MSGRDRISRYTTAKGDQGQYQPGSRGRVLANLPGISIKTEMDRAEYEALLLAQERHLRIITAQTRFTTELICRMHRDWLGRLYGWAGQFRNVDLSKAGFHWPPATRVAENMSRFENGLLAKNTPCRRGTVGEVARGIAEVHAELLLIHPFRDGNGRLARWLADLMALQAGLAVPDYGFTGRGAKTQRERYLAAIVAGYTMDYEPLTAFLEAALARSPRAWGTAE